MPLEQRLASSGTLVVVTLGLAGLVFVLGPPLARASRRC